MISEVNKRVHPTHHEIIMNTDTIANNESHSHLKVVAAGKTYKFIY